MRVLTKIEIFVRVYSPFASINAKNCDCKKPQICPWFPPKIWEESGSKTKIRRSKHRKGSGAQEAGQNNGGEPLEQEQHWEDAHQGERKVGPDRTSGETKKAEMQLKLVQAESAIAVSEACLILTVLAGAWCYDGGGQGHLRPQRWMNVGEYGGAAGALNEPL